MEDLDVPEAPRRGDDLAVLGLAGFEGDDLETQLVTLSSMTHVQMDNADLLLSLA